MRKYISNYPYGIEQVSINRIKKTSAFGDFSNLQMFEKVINHFINHPNEMVVPVYNYIYYGYNSDHKYSYEMDMLLPLNYEEKDIIDTFADSLSWNFDTCKYYYSFEEVLTQNNRMQTIVSKQKDYSDLFTFIKQVVDNAMYIDLHGGNIMIDTNDQYKLIDIEGFNYDWVK